ncbi:MAG: ABC-F family ATP-binding cassette domain-containing protein [Acidimicrobiales bacterium]
MLRNVSVTVGPRTRLGIVGPNGSGKSTLLQVLAGIRAADAGAIELAPPDATVGYLAQEHERRPEETVRAHLHRVTGIAAADAQLQNTATALGSDTEAAADAYAAALDHWHRLGAADIDARVDSTLRELGLAGSVADQPTASLSGGQASRVALAAVVLSRFDIMLLDEPTNDLDFDGLDRLTRTVTRHRGGIAVVSHDRAFLDETIDSVLEIDEHDHSATLYRGGWSAYLDERATARHHAEESFAGYQARRSALLERARRERQWATTGVAKERRSPRDNDKAQRKFRMDRSEQLAARARRTEQAIERLEVVDKPWEGWELRLQISGAPRAGAVVARLVGAVIGQGSFRSGPIDLEIAWADRVALVGPNGAGKTTLLDSLLGRLPLLAGSRWIGPSVVVGELGQRRSAFDGPGKLLDAFTGTTGLLDSDARTLLAKFGLGSEHVLRRTASLSPGERTRAELAGFQASGVNFLVLDEPTNHLDVPAVEQLEQAVAAFTGTMLVVSHDRRFLEALDLDRTLMLD